MIGRARSRQEMVERQIAARGIRDPAVLAAMRTVPREMFVAAAAARRAYEDSALAIDEGQTISQPYIVALMLEAAGVGPQDHVLEVGAGSGYAAAVISRIAERVWAVERHARLAEQAEARWAALGYANIRLRVGDGTEGWVEHAPFDAIIVSAAGRAIPLALQEQLEIGGRLVIPIGDADLQRLLKITRTSGTRFEEEDLGPVRFVPLVGADG
jgi:protein-L-isoaspartate(D-aspartate) O-methyltransferase